MNIISFKLKVNYFINCLLIVSSCLIIGCSKNEDDHQQKKSDQISQQTEPEYVPFFELAKGDTIPKGVFREKPEYNGEDVVVLYSSENKFRTKAQGNSSGSGYIKNLKTSVRSDNSAGSTMDGYTKIPVDLNEGAGGKYIYLYYIKTETSTEALCYLKVRNNCCTPFFSTEHEYMQKLGISFGSNGWTDLNQGAGGYYIVLEGCSNNNIAGWITAQARAGGSIGWIPSDTQPIKDILIISSSSKMSSYSGWTFIDVDLNKGAGGKWIYLCYKK
jgi:hypothetical protein